MVMDEVVINFIETIEEVTINVTEAVAGTNIPRVKVIETGVTIDVNCDFYDQVDVIQLASNTTITTPSGTPYDGKKIMYRVLDNNLSRQVLFDGGFADIVGVPNNTIPSKVTRYGVEWVASRNKWEIIATVTEPS